MPRYLDKFKNEKERVSLHGELASISIHDFVSDNHFFSASPEVFVTPCVAPFHEVEHRHHGESKSPCERLSSYYWEKEIDK